MTRTTEAKESLSNHTSETGWITHQKVMCVCVFNCSFPMWSKVLQCAGRNYWPPHMVQNGPSNCSCSCVSIGYVIQFSFDLHLCVSYCEYAHRTRQMRISNFLKASINPECSNHSVNSDRLYGALEMGRFVCLISRLWDERDFRWGWTWL